MLLGIRIAAACRGQDSENDFDEGLVAMVNVCVCVCIIGTQVKVLQSWKTMGQPSRKVNINQHHFPFPNTKINIQGKPCKNVKSYYGLKNGLVVFCLHLLHHHYIKFKGSFSE